MYSKKESIQQLVYLLKQHNVCHIVVSPGSRNMPLAESFYSDSSFHCYSVTDERSAGFFAIGLILKYNQPVALCCTSGSALLNYGSAISEAFYQELPLLVLSADRPQAWIGQMDGQTMQQTNLFGNLFEKEVNLPIIKTEEDNWYCNRLINEALLFLTSNKICPVHINIPIDEPFFDCSAEILPKTRLIYKNRDIAEVWDRASRPLIVIGQMHPYSTEGISNILAALNCPVLSENIGNIKGLKNSIHYFEAILMNPKQELEPDLVIYLGGHIVSKRLKQWLRKCKPNSCCRIDTSNEIKDTFQCLTDIYNGDASSCLQNLSPKSANNKYLSIWKELNDLCYKNINSFDVSNSLSLKSIKELISKIPPQSALFLGNSNTIRQSQFFYREEINYFCNRGINGIDGSLSSAVGYASVSNHLTFMIIGDLSFFYDINALWNIHLSPNLRILLLNNHGGGIFKSLPGLKQSKAVDDLIITQNNLSAKGWSESVGITYLQQDEQSFSADTIHLLISPSETPILVELNCDAELSSKEYQSFLEYLQEGSLNFPSLKETSFL